MDRPRQLLGPCLALLWLSAGCDLSGGDFASPAPDVAAVTAAPTRAVSPPPAPVLASAVPRAFDETPREKASPRVEAAVVSVAAPNNSPSHAADRQPVPDPCDLELEALREVDPASVPQLFFGPTDDKVVALTFDDGPSPTYTPRVLRTLAHYDIQATFFMLGERVDKMPELTNAVVDAGHELGNHTWSHPSMRSLWKSQIREEVCGTTEAIRRATGLRPTLFRPPFGRFAPSAVPLLGALGFDFILWSADGADWDVEDPQRIAKSVVDEAKPGSIILLHDSKAITVEALPLVISGLKARGFSIVPVSELVGLDPYLEPTGFSPTGVRGESPPQR